MRFKKISILALAMCMLCAVFLVSCGSNPADEAMKKVDSVKVEDYMTDDHDAIENLIKDTKKSLEKAKESDIESITLEFDEALAKFATKNAQIDSFKKLILKQASNDKDKAKVEEILDNYKKDFGEVKSNADLKKITDEINKKVSKALKKDVKVNSSAIKEATIKKNEAKVEKSHSSSSSSNKKPSKPSNGSSNPGSSSGNGSSSGGSGGSSSGSGSSSGGSTAPSEPAPHQHVWTSAYNYRDKFTCNECEFTAYSEDAIKNHGDNERHLAYSVDSEEYVAYTYCIDCGARR